MGVKSFDLHQDIWGQIFDQLDEQNLQEISLVSKEFFSITNTVKKTLNIHDKTLPSLGGILRRFPYLDSINFCLTSRSCYIELLHQLSHSELHREGMKSLKRVNFKESDYYSDKSLLDSHVFIAIAGLFPWIEEINIPTLVVLDDGELQNLQLKLKALKKLSFEWGRWAKDNYFPSNEALISLSLNCENLEELDIGESCLITEETVGFIMRHSPKLTTLKLPYMLPSHASARLSIQNSIAYVKNLHTFRSHSGTISEEVLNSIVKANLPLQNFEIEFHNVEVKASNLLLLFQACSSIQHLYLGQDFWLLDSCVKKIAQLLTKLTHINLSYNNLTTASFFILTQNCPFLKEIIMSATKIGTTENFPTILNKHKRVRYLNLRDNMHLDDKTLQSILLVCPNLQSIDVDSCPRLTGEGVCEILKTCVLVKKLDINFLKVSNIFGSNFEGTTGLKVLLALKTQLTDAALGEIGRICPHLEFLKIGCCERVTNNGVMEVVKNCKKLKKIDMRRCKNLGMDILGDKLRSISKDLKYVHESQL